MVSSSSRALLSHLAMRLDSMPVVENGCLSAFDSTGALSSMPDDLSARWQCLVSPCAQSVRPGGGICRCNAHKLEWVHTMLLQNLDERSVVQHAPMEEQH